MKKKWLLTIIIFVPVFLSFSQNAQAAAIYYVSPTGSNSNPGTSSAPLRTITKAMSNVVAGDTVIVGNGVYNERVVIDKSGSASARITLKAAEDKGAIVDGTGISFAYPKDEALLQIGASDKRASYLTVSGLIVRNSSGRGLNNYGENNLLERLTITTAMYKAVNIRDANNTIFRNNEVANSGLCNKDGARCGEDWPGMLQVWNSDNVQVVGNLIHNNWGEGLTAWLGATNTKIIGNILYDNWSVNIYVDHGVNTLIERNFIYDTNTVYIPLADPNRWNIGGGIGIQDEPYDWFLGCHATDTIVRNNIIVNTRTGITSYPMQSCTGLKNAIIENNTIVNSWDGDLRILSNQTVGNIFRNNIVYTRSEGVVVKMTRANDTRFENNLFYHPSGSATGQFIWNGVTYNSLASWQSAAGAIVKNNMWANPFLTNKGGFTPDSYRLNSNSSAIDKGTTSLAGTDFWNSHRPVGAAFDIGAHEFSSAVNPFSSPTGTPARTATSTIKPSATSSPTNTPRATSSPTRTPTPTILPIGGGPSATRTQTPTPTRTPSEVPTVLPGDINRDGTVNALDYVLLFENFTPKSVVDIRADINGDGLINALDYVVLFENFGRRW